MFIFIYIFHKNSDSIPPNISFPTKKFEILIFLLIFKGF